MAVGSWDDHPKLFALCAALRVTIRDAHGTGCLLWSNANKSSNVRTTDGWIKGGSAGLIAHWCMWELTDADRLLEALVSVGLIDRDADGKLYIHDYADWCPDYVKRREQRNGFGASLSGRTKREDRYTDGEFTDSDQAVSGHRHVNDRSLTSQRSTNGSSPDGHWDAPTDTDTRTDTDTESVLNTTGKGGSGGESARQRKSQIACAIHSPASGTDCYAESDRPVRVGAQTKADRQRWIQTATLKILTALQIRGPDHARNQRPIGAILRAIVEHEHRDDDLELMLTEAKAKARDPTLQKPIAAWTAWAKQTWRTGT